jgi:mono/diheme cytochrome c family protein
MLTRSNLIRVGSLGGAAFIAISFTAPPTMAQPASGGRDVAQRNCAQCHAIGMTSQSRLKGAPPFRDLSNIGEMDDLVNALRGGLLLHHPAMPELEADAKGDHCTQRLPARRSDEEVDLPQ